MKKSELRKLIKEEIKTLKTEGQSPDLTIGKEYTVLEPGMNEWMSGLEYLGYDRNENEHVFRDSDNIPPGGNEVFFMKVFDADLKDSVKIEHEGNKYDILSK